MKHTRPYSPMLKAKDGEFKSILTLGTSARNQIMPHFDITPMDWDQKNNRYKRTLESHLENKIRKIIKVWGRQDEVFLDFEFDSSIKASDGRNRLSCAYELSSLSGMNAIFATSFDVEQEYNEILKGIISSDQKGVRFRIFPEHMSDGVNLKKRMDELMSFLRIPTAEVSVLLDFKYLTEAELEESTKLAKRTISVLSNFPPFHSIVIAASAMPEYLTDIDKDSITSINRTEVQLWKGLVPASVDTTQHFVFGDYGVAHAYYLQPTIVRASANIRYSTEEQIIIFKGRKLEKNKWEEQFSNLSKVAMSHEQYRGRSYSWGDEYIARCASGAAGSGSLTTWRQVGTNHHLTLMAESIRLSPVFAVARQR